VTRAASAADSGVAWGASGLLQRATRAILITGLQVV
jgi:hypothetical protein